MVLHSTFEDMKIRTVIVTISFHVNTVNSGIDTNIIVQGTSRQVCVVFHSIVVCYEVCVFIIEIYDFVYVLVCVDCVVV